MANPQNIIPPKKGERRNPNGRPKGSKNFKTVIRKFLDAMQNKKSPISGKEEMLSIQEQMVLAMIGKALKGDVTAFREIADRLEGRTKEQKEGQDPGTEKNPIYITLNGQQIRVE